MSSEQYYPSRPGEGLADSSSPIEPDEVGGRRVDDVPYKPRLSTTRGMRSAKLMVDGREIRFVTRLRSSTKAAMNNPKLKNFEARLRQSITQPRGVRRLRVRARKHGDLGMGPHGSGHDTTDRKESKAEDAGGKAESCSQWVCSEGEVSEEDEFASYEWLEPIECFAQGEDSRDYCSAKLIRRDAIRPNFWTRMNEPGASTRDLAVSLFDRYGKLRTEFCQHEINKGTGAWGIEIGSGDIVLLDFFSSPPPWHKTTRKMVQNIILKAKHRSDDFFVVVNPTSVIGVCAQGYGEKLICVSLPLAEVFFRSLGFRRVGKSPWFAYTMDQTHPSRELSPDLDWDISQGPLQIDVADSVLAAMGTLSDPKASEDDCRVQIQEMMTDEVARPSISSTDQDGNTILHVAALHGRPLAVAWILSLHPQLAQIRNLRGHTPAEALESAMELSRTLLIKENSITNVSDAFHGFPHMSVACQAAFLDMKVYDVTEWQKWYFDPVRNEWVVKHANMEILNDSLRLTYGCTCGQCVGGYLSPRMHFAIQCQAKAERNRLLIELGSVPLFLKNLEGRYSSMFMTPELREDMEVDSSLRNGLVEVWERIIECLETGGSPTVQSVEAMVLGGNVDWFLLQKMLKNIDLVIRVAGQAMFKHAMMHDQWAGDGKHMRGFAKEVLKHPTCRNDHEFRFASGMCGYERVVPEAFLRKIPAVGDMMHKVTPALAYRRLQRMGGRETERDLVCADLI